MKKYLVCILMLTPIFSWAQSITGTVVDSDGQSIAFANVVLCQAADSTIIAGCTSDENGKFYFSTETKVKMYLRVSFVGYKTKYVELGASPLRIMLEPMMLNEIVVVARRKLYEQRSGEMIANVKGTILETLPKTTDIIAQLPFVSSQDGNFTVFGKGTPIIYINNRLVQNLKELDRLMPSEIKSIKVNTMPGAKYDATVGAVIQIITKKTQGEGLSGTLYAGSKCSELWSTEEFASLNYRHNAWDVFASSYLIQKRQQINMKANQQLDLVDAVHEIGYQEEEKVKSNRVSVVGGINYNPNEKISAGVQYVLNSATWKDDMYNHISHTVNNEMELKQQLASSNNPDHTHNINSYFTGNLSNNLSLDFNFDWVKGNERDNMYSWFPDNTSEDVNTVNNRWYNYYASKGIMTYTNKYVNIEGGAEYSYTDMTQTYEIDNNTLGINNSDDVTKQNRWALFASAKFQFGNWGVGAGMRYEDIDFDYYKNKEWNKEQSKKYHKLFPNLFANYSKGDLQATLSYERKIKYPNYSLLRSNIQYSSPYIYESGNPMLLPQIQNDFTCILGYKDIKAILGYTIYEDYITQMVELYNESSVVLVKPDNMKDVKNRFFALSYTPTIGIWRPSIELGGQWQDLNLSGKIYDKPIFNLRLNNSLTFPHQWFVTVNAGWQSEGNSGIYLIKPSLKTNVNISKTLFDKKMSISLMVNDIFRTDKIQWCIDHSHIVFDYDKYSDSRYVQLTVQYNFNSTKSKYKGGSSSDEKQRL